MGSRNKTIKTEGRELLWENTQVSPRDRGCLFLRRQWVPPGDGDRIQSPNLMFQIKVGTMDNVHNCDSYGLLINCTLNHICMFMQCGITRLEAWFGI
jgi:hypothetical protein